MSAVLSTVLPVFGLIAIGFLAGRSGYVSEVAARGLPEFMFKVAMPALLFRTMGTTRLPDIAPHAIFVAYFGASLATWVLALALSRLALRRTSAEAPSICFAASFSNAVMMGIPLCLSYFGDRSAAVLALIIAFDVALLWTAAAVQLAWAERHEVGATGRPLLVTLRDVVRRLATNPIILATAAGAAWQAAGLALPPLVDRVISLLGQAGVPGALCALGLTLATFELRGQMATVIGITALKLMVMPLVAWLLASQVLGLDPVTVAILTVVAALPVGANAFLFASVHERAAASVSGAVTLSIVLSVLTISASLFLIGTTQ